MYPGQGVSHRYRNGNCETTSGRCCRPTIQQEQGALSRTIGTKPNEAVERTPNSFRSYHSAGLVVVSHKTNGYCWRTQKCRNLCIPHAFLEGKKAWETCARKSSSRTFEVDSPTVSLRFPPLFDC